MRIPGCVKYYFIKQQDYLIHWVGLKFGFSHWYLNGQVNYSSIVEFRRRYYINQTLHHLLLLQAASISFTMTESEVQVFFFSLLLFINFIFQLFHKYFKVIFFKKFFYEISCQNQHFYAHLLILSILLYGCVSLFDFLSPCFNNQRSICLLVLFIL